MFVRNGLGEFKNPTRRMFRCGGFVIRHFFLLGFAIRKYWQLD